MSLFKRRNKDLFTVSEPGRATPDVEPVASGFRLPVVDVFAIARRGVVVTGTIETGTVVSGAQVTVERQGRPPIETVITGVETARKRADWASAGDNVGLLLRGLDRSDVVTGDVVRT